MSDLVRNFLLGVAVAAALAGTRAGAVAETNQIRIVSTPGLAQFPGRYAFEQGLIAAKVKEHGLGDVKITFQQVTSGNVVSDLLLSANADVGVGGNVPLFTLWDKTRGAQKVRGIMPFSQGHMFLISVDPKIKSIKDYADTDRIAMTGVRSTTYSMLLQMAAAKEFGWEARTKLDNIAVGMGNDDALVALLSLKHEVKSHMTIMPHSTLELESGKAHVVMSSKDVLGAPYTFVVAMATEKFQQENPKTYTAIAAALEEAIGEFNSSPRKVAEAFLKLEKFKGSVDDVAAMISGKTPDELKFTSVPTSTTSFTDFMLRSATMRNKPQSWKDLWFENVWTKPGN